MLPLVAAAAVMSACLCPEYCKPLTTPFPKTEVVAFAPHPEAWKTYNMSTLTTIMKFSELVDMPALVCKAHAANVRVVYSTRFPSTQLDNPAAIAAFAKNVSATVAELGLDGFNFDQEHDTRDAQGLTNLVKAVSDSLRVANPLAQISFDVSIGGGPSSGYNLREIAEHIDFFIPMGYDMCWGTRVAKPNSPMAGLVRGIEHFKAMGFQHKTVLGLPWYGWDFPCKAPKPDGGCPVVTPFGGGSWQSTFDRILALEQSATVKPRYTAAGDARFFSYESDGSTHQVYYDDALTLAKKYELVPTHGLRGVAVWYAGCVSPDTPQGEAMWKALGTVKK